MNVPLHEQIKCVEREIAMRRAVYPKQVESRRIKQAAADREIGLMTAVLESLKILQRYADPNNWRFYHDEEGKLQWVTTIGPDAAMEVTNGEN